MKKDKCPCKKTSIGGQALMEGIMMRGPKKTAMAVRNPEGEIVLDEIGKKSGRGAYICPDRKCLLMARKAKRFGRALSCEIPEEILEKMRQEISADE